MAIRASANIKWQQEDHFYSKLQGKPMKTTVQFGVHKYVTYLKATMKA
jgi:hypothetical protein